VSTPVYAKPGHERRLHTMLENHLSRFGHNFDMKEGLYTIITQESFEAWYIDANGNNKTSHFYHTLIS
jgi:hypothetical protein